MGGVNNPYLYVRGALPLGERVHVQRDEQPVQQLVREHLVQSVQADAEDVVQVVQVIQVFGHQVGQEVTTSVTTRCKVKHNNTMSSQVIL